jgi:glycosyltransferase involved in cell wall biosynthesis
LKPSLSVLMSVYNNEKPEFLAQSLDSLKLQTYQAEEIVIVEDGPLGRSLSDVIIRYALELPIVSVKLPNNVGLGAALARGICACHGDLIARADSDDICLPDRFKKQMDWLSAHPDIDLLGGAYAEFDSNSFGPRLVRRVPKSGKELMNYAKTRTPFNHTTVIFRKSAVLGIGNYESAIGFEDYLLGARMLMGGYTLYNLEDVLVYVRAGRGFTERRGGLSYVQKEMAFQLCLREIGFITTFECARNILLRTPVRLIPNSLRRFIYRRFLRSTPGRFAEVG